jgi:glucosamine--fructose-6-phosphate aminotransferase (isomerizing)
VSSFRAEIAEQPEVVARLLDHADAVLPIGAAIKAANPVGVLIAARGSSDNAAVFAKYVIQQRNRLPVALAAPSLFTHYAAPPRLAGYCVVGVSQSGASPDVTAVIAEARAQGSITVAITNHPDSELAAAADFVIQLRAGSELSIPASKTYTASLVAIALLSVAIDTDPAFEAALHLVPEAMRQAMGCEDQARQMAGLLAGPRLAVIGRGFNLSTAEELALKLTETAYLLARAWSAADFLHGPIAVAGDGLPLVVVEAQGPTSAYTRMVATRLLRAGAEVFQIADGTQPLGQVAASITLSTGLPEVLTPLSLAVAAQLLSYHVAVRRGLDPDKPRALKKVTRTR